MDAPAFDAQRLVRPALLTIALYLSVIVIASMTMVKPAQASGTVNAATLYYGGSNSSGYNCNGMTSLDAVQGCVVAMHDKWLSDDLNGLNSNPIILPPLPLSCPTAVLTDSGPSGSYVDMFKITYYRGAVNAAGWTCCPIYYKFCDGPKIDNYHISTQLSCPANSTQTSSTCTCNTNFVPDPSATNCISEPYTIALSGLGGDVMPTTTRAAYAEVTTSTGSSKSGAQVTLILTVVPENGDPILASNVGSLSPNGGSTGADGRLPFVFTAPAAGGTHTIDAFCTGCTNYAEGTTKVPGCPIPPLTVLTDPVAIGFDNGNRWRPDLLTGDYPAHLTCVENAITAAHGTYTGTSAYRPTQYQRHLYEIVQKDAQLDTENYMPAHPECQALRDEVTGEMGPPPGHNLQPGQQVATPGSSRHESGMAFDLTPHGLSAAQLAPIYPSCGVSHTAVSGEPWHVQ